MALPQYPLLRGTIWPLSGETSGRRFARFARSNDATNFFQLPAAHRARFARTASPCISNSTANGSGAPFFRVSAARATRALDQKSRGGIKVSRIPVSSAYEQLQAEGCRSFCRRRHLRGALDPGERRPKLDERGIARSSPGRQLRDQPENAALPAKFRGAPMAMRMPPPNPEAGQHGRVPRQPARARPLSRRRLVRLVNRHSRGSRDS